MITTMSYRSFIKVQKRRFGDFCKVSYRLSILDNEGLKKEEFFTKGNLMVPGQKRLYLRIRLPYKAYVFDVTYAIIQLQREVRKRIAKQT